MMSLTAAWSASATSSGQAELVFLPEKEGTPGEVTYFRKQVLSLKVTYPEILIPPGPRLPPVWCHI